MSVTAISARNLSKGYRLGVIGRHTFVDEVTHAWHRLWGRDPRAHMGKIGHTATETRRVEAEAGGESQFWALRDVSFDIQPGEVVGIIGRNGAGKSTLLKVLSRITEPTDGEAFIEGRVGSLLEVGTGFHPELTGRENIYMNGTILGMKTREIQERFDEIVDFAEIAQFLDTPVKRYSSGMYVRLAFSVAAHLEAEILLVDEVLAVGDVEFQNKCMGKMSDVATQGRTVLLVSHNMAAVENLCRRVLLMDGGRLAADGPPADVIGEYLRRSSPEGVGDVDLGAVTERSGNGSARLLRLRVVDASGRTVNHLQSGTDCALELTVRAGQPVDDLVPGLRVHDHLGKALFQCRSDIVAPPFRCGNGDMTLICCLPRLPLQAGSYSISAGLMARGELADWVEHAIRIVVETGDFYGTGRLPNRLKGCFLVDYSWSTAAGEGS